MQNAHILARTKELLGSGIITGNKLQPFLTGFRGKQGHAIAAVSPSSIVLLYKLIRLYHELNVAYILQGANTALKGQGTPNGTPEKPVVIIRTNLLCQYKLLNYPGSEEFKILLVEPGLSLSAAEKILNQIAYDLPHKIGSHDLGNTFGASCANGCGGVRVDNRDGRSSMTMKGNMGVVAISANGLIYNGFIRRKNLESGEDLLSAIDANTLEINDIELPDIHEIEDFLHSLLQHKSYPIHNHRGEIVSAGDGGEGLQAIAYQMYLIRKKPVQIKTYGILFADINSKEKFYKELIFSALNNDTQNLPILCESMNSDLVEEIVKHGVGYLNAILLAIAPNWVGKSAGTLLKTRTSMIKFCPYWYIVLESFIGKLLSKLFTPKALSKLNFKEFLLIQVANRNNLSRHIQEFEQRLKIFVHKNSDSVRSQEVAAGSFQERLLLQIRNVAAITTLTLAQKHNWELLAFDDGVMPGKMLNQYCDLLFTELVKKFPGKVSRPYLYGHDLKQINHNDWIIQHKLTEEELTEVHQLQHRVMESIGGIPHAEHGVGDYAATDLNRNELVKLIAHRLLNDINGIANSGGGFEKAFEKALLDKGIVEDGISFAENCLKRECERKTLMTWEEKMAPNLHNKLSANIQTLLTHITRENKKLI